MEILDVIINNGGLAALAFVLYKLFQDQREDRNENEKALRSLIEKQNERFNAQDLQLQAIVITQEKIIERLEKMESKGVDVSDE